MLVIVVLSWGRKPWCWLREHRHEASRSGLAQRRSKLLGKKLWCYSALILVMSVAVGCSSDPAGGGPVTPDVPDVGPDEPVDCENFTIQDGA